MARKMKDSGIEWIGEIPEGWEVVKLKNFASISSGTALPKDDYDFEGNIPVVGSNGKIATVYKGNIIKNLIMDCQSYTKYRPNETMGGIFVSWRRKEELPTGA